MAGEAQKFRPDIEGLRGVAILLVVLFHANVAWLGGGFVGVDVFFVLSGYFITGLLMRELDASGTVDVSAFYGRRALRLLPALLVVLLVTLAIVMWVYAPIDRPSINATARAMSLYAGNVHFAQQARDYFGSSDNPLLHTWSLAVEEQFYLVWPLLLLAAWQRTRSRAAIAGAAALSFAACVWLTHVHQQWAFYLMPTRVWEFALGAGALLLLRERTLTGSRTWTMVQAAGCIAIVLSLALYDRMTPYPGVAALLPALGAVALLVGGDVMPDSPISKALGAGWLRWLGRMSYAWYLWHWPLVGLGAVLDPRIGVAGRLAWSAVALVLAWLTYRYLEQSARGGVLARIPQGAVTIAAVGASVAVALAAHVATMRATREISRGIQATYAAARGDRMDHDCWATTVDDPRGPCVFGDTHSSTVLALLGDSHAEHWLGALDAAGRTHGWKIVAMVKGGCPVADMPQLVNARLKRIYFECTRYRDAMLRRIIAMRPTAVILSSWDHYFPVNGGGEDWQVTPAVWRNGLRRTYARLAAAGIPIIAIRGTRRAWFDVPACLSRRAAHVPFARECVYDRGESLSPAAVRAQDDAARGLPVRFVDMNDQLCNTPRCPVVRNGAVVFTDDNHLTATFSRTLAPVLGGRLQGALASTSSR